MTATTSRKPIATTLACALILLAVTSAPAHADNVQNDVTSTLTGKIVSVTKGDGTGAVVGFQIQETNGDSTDTTGQNAQSCNAADGSAAVVQPSGVPAGVTTTPTSLSFDTCGAWKYMTFKASSTAVAGDYSITVSVSDSEAAITGKDYNTSPATFTLRVGAAVSADCTTGRSAPVAPTIAANTPAATGWFNSTTGPGKFTIAPAMNAEYSVNGGAWTAYSSEVTLPDGEHSVVARNFLPATTDCARVNGTASDATALKVDVTAPAVSFTNYTPESADGLNDWYVSNVTANFSASDATSGLANATGSTQLTVDGENLTAQSPQFTDIAGNTAAAGAATSNPAVKIDKTPPVVSVTGVVSGQQYVLGATPTPNPDCSTTDARSGVETAASLSIIGGLVGSITATCSGAKDNAGNTNSASVTYSVIYKWDGFLRPVDNLPTWNSVKAGSGVPVKFSLGGEQGLDIFWTEVKDGVRLTYPKSEDIACDSDAQVDGIEQTVTAGGSSLSYDSFTGQYTYVWKTEKAWAGKCRQLVVKLKDGTFHRANFSLTK